MAHFFMYSPWATASWLITSRTPKISSSAVFRSDGAVAAGEGSTTGSGELVSGDVREQAAANTKESM
ncbi:hypothetical protein [Nannocystis pusilla]|uniref:hypothetical protein n=1 Tax=Nannocystis pusilla TaxID=889268 RepID=UPI003B7AD492